MGGMSTALRGHASAFHFVQSLPREGGMSTALRGHAGKWNGYMN